MANHVSNEDMKQCIPQMTAGWWASKTEEEKTWYLKFWAFCRKL